MRRDRVAAAVLVVAAMATACGSDGEETVAVGRSVIATEENRLSRTHEAPSLLIDRDDPDTVYLAHVELQAGDCRFMVSTDRGATWKPSEGPEASPFTDCGLGPSNPKNVRTELHQDSRGTIYYLAAAHDPAAGGSRSVVLGRSTDKGLTWRTVPVYTAPAAANPQEQPEQIEINFQAHLAIDPDNEQRLYVTWRRAYQVAGDPPRPTRPFLAVSEDGGATFGPPVMLMDKATGFEGPRLQVLDGRLHAFYRENPPPAGSVPEPRLTRVVSSISTDGGRTWTDHEVTAQRDASEPVSIYDPERRTFYLVWHDNRNQDLDIFFSKSADGRTWSEPRQLNDDPKGMRIGQFYPKISLVPGGRIDVAWYDFRNDPFPAPTVAPTATAPFLGLTTNVGKFDAVYVASSEDGGDSWSENVRVSDVPNDRTLGTAGPQYFVQVPLAVASWEDRTLVAWSDTRHGNTDNSTQDIATNAVDYTTTSEAGYRPRDVVLGLLAGALLGAGVMLWVTLARGRRRPAPAPAKEPEAVA